MSTNEVLREPVVDISKFSEDYPLIDEFRLRFNDISEVRQREDGLLECEVPLKHILTDGTAVEEERVSDLARSMIVEREKLGKGNGQLAPLLLGFISGENQLHIIDGFHRVPALKKTGAEAAWITVRGSTWDDIIDLRILTSTIHKDVQFARVIDWVSDAWGRTPWVNKITVAQAFQLYINNATYGGKRLGVAEEIADIRNWVKEKSTRWQISPSTIKHNLAVAAHADPGLVQDARLRTDVTQLRNITPGHLKVIAEGAPGPKMFDLQKLIATTAKQYNLTTEETQRLTGVLVEISDIKKAEKLLKAVDHKTAKPELIKSRSSAKIIGQLGVHEGRSPNSESIIPKRSVDQLLSNARVVIKTASTQPNDTESRQQLAATREDLTKVGLQIASLLSKIDKIEADNTPEITRRVIKNEVRSPAKSVTDTDIKPATVRQLHRGERIPAQRPAPGNSLSDALIKYLVNGGKMPEMNTLSDVTRAERAIRNMPPGGDFDRAEDLLQEANELRRVLEMSI